MKHEPDDRIKKEVAKRLRLAREALGLRPVDIANATNVLPPKVSQYEAGTYFPRWSWLVKLHELYGIDANFLVLNELDGLPLHLQARIGELTDHAELPEKRATGKMEKEGTYTAAAPPGEDEAAVSTDRARLALKEAKQILGEVYGDPTSDHAMRAAVYLAGEIMADWRRISVE